MSRFYGSLCKFNMSNLCYNHQGQILVSLSLILLFLDLTQPDNFALKTTERILSILYVDKKGLIEFWKSS